MDFEAKDDVLWRFIARAAYSGLVAYIALILLAVSRDLFRRNSAQRRSKRAFQRSKYGLMVLHDAFLSRYRDTNLFYWVELLRLSANLVVCIVYIVGTYRQTAAGPVQAIQRVFGAFFAVDLIGRLWYVESAITSMLSIAAFLEAMSFPSMFMASGPADYLNFSFLRSISAYSAYSRLERRVYVASFSQERLIIRLAFLCLTLFYTLAAGIQLLEIPGDLLPADFRARWDAFGDWNFFNSCYFVVVTLSTVGYGDFSPATVQGRIFTFFMIIVGIVIFTSAISEIVEQSQNSRGSGTLIKRADTRHVIVAGTPTVTDLIHFVSEFYSDTRQSNIKAKVLVLVEEPNWTDTEWFQHIAKNQFLQSRMQFLIGSVRNESDLQRARINSADAVFFLTSPSTGEEPSFQDTRTVMNTLAIRNVRTDIPIYSQVLLQDSNVQMQLALTTPSSVSKDTYYRGKKEMTASATYQGLFQEVLRTEYQTMPRTHQKKGLRSLEDVLMHYSKVHKDSGLRKEDVVINNDLERSEFVCLQELHMALISGNVKANGVGTLLSNMYLDVQPRRIEDDPAWLTEYHMGASCSLAYAIIPEDLSGVTVREIAGDLFHLGLVLIATNHPVRSSPEPVLTTDRFLRGGDVAMFLTYHQARYVVTALQLVVHRYTTGSLRHSVGTATTPLSVRSSATAAGSSFAVQHSLDLPPPQTFGGIPSQSLQHASTSPLRQTSNMASSFRMPYIPVSRNGSTPLSGMNNSSSEDFLGTSIFDSSVNINLLGKRSDGYMPDNLAGHVIVAMEGETPLRNLPLLLKNLWHKDCRKSLAKATKEPVVVIHPCVSSQYRSLFAHVEKKCLFFVEGSPASQSTWERAKLSTAKSVATMADYTQPWYFSDARTIFTFMTLDVSTLNDQDVFVCSELVDEKSLEFLREPTHPRRVGAILGEPELAVSPPPSPIAPAPVEPELPKRESPILTSSARSAAASIPHRIAAKAKKVLDSDKSRKHTGSHSETTDEEMRSNLSNPPLTRTNSRGSHGSAGPSNLDSTPNRATSERPPLLSKFQRPSLAHGMKSLRGIKENVGDVSPVSPPGSPLSQTGRGQEGVGKKARSEVPTSPRPDVTSPDEPGKSEAAKERRGTLFSRSRYASGELLIHSSAIALLIREYVEPGFVRFYASLLGADAMCSGLKIRLVRIPKSMFEDQMSLIRKDGKKLVRFSIIFKNLVRHGATPLGIYRSGNAPVLLPSKLRRKRGAAVYKEAMSFLAEDGTVEHVDMKGDSSTLQKAKRFVMEQLANVAPSKVREAQGRDAIRGGGEFSSSSEDSSSETEEEGDYDKIHEFDNASLGSFASPGSRHVGEDGPPSSIKRVPLRPKLKRGDAEHRSADEHESEEEMEEPPIAAIEPSHATDKVSLPRRSGFLTRMMAGEEEPHDALGARKFKEVEVPGNLLPYVYTMPDPNTWCAETDGIFILCHPSLDLPRKWTETTNAALNDD